MSETYHRTKEKANCEERNTMIMIGTYLKKSEMVRFKNALSNVTNPLSREAGTITIFNK